MYEATNGAISREMESRRKQAEAERDRQHELQLAKVKAQPVQQPAYQPPVEQYGDEERQARNRQLLGMAGLHGQSVRSDGRGGVSVHHHAFADSPFGRALLG
jgi:hypothetical protein